MSPPAFDIFCRVIDNLGDAGVCWRLARQLSHRGYAVRLWMDDLNALAKLVPGLAPTRGAQPIDHVRIGTWRDARTAHAPLHGVVIEAFGCTLPPAYRASIARRKCVWINLEYLSAESWVEGCHGLPSPQPDGAPKYFYFPGFTVDTGGLLREPDLMRRQAEARGRDRRERLKALTGLATDTLSPDTLCVLLFCYPDAPIQGLLDALGGVDRPVWLLIPGQNPLSESTPLTHSSRVRVQPIAFVPQADFDALLWCCDLNFVRGEDSLVRALWAGAPLVWQLYPQAENAHLEKLRAWLERARLPALPEAVLTAWNRGDNAQIARLLPAILNGDGWSRWQARSAAWRETLLAQPDLVQGVLAFCQRHRQTG